MIKGFSALMNYLVFHRRCAEPIRCWETATVPPGSYQRLSETCPNDIPSPSCRVSGTNRQKRERILCCQNSSTASSPTRSRFEPQTSTQTSGGHGSENQDQSEVQVLAFKSRLQNPILSGHSAVTNTERALVGLQRDFRLLPEYDDCQAKSKS